MPALKQLAKTCLPRQLPVVTGGIRGMWWTVSSSNISCWWGNYETTLQHNLARALSPGSLFVDVGANVGFFTLLGARAVGPSGKVLAFEPHPENFVLLSRHVQYNRLGNVELWNWAVSNRSGSARFELSPSHAMGKLSETGTHEVVTVTLDEVLQPPANTGPSNPATVIKVDVEGWEVEVLDGAAWTLQVLRPIWFVAAHGSSKKEQCLARFTAAGYACQVRPGIEGGGHYDIMATASHGN